MSSQQLRAGGRCVFGGPDLCKPASGGFYFHVLGVVRRQRIILASGLHCWIAGWAALLVVGGAFTVTSALADDWPTYHHDFQRSATSAETLPGDLAVRWTYRAPAAPRAAWDEPATWDGYNKVFDLKNRQVFDKAIHPIVVGDRVFFGSSVDDQVYCLDLKSGEQRWRFFTEGPIRLAPTWHNDRIFVGSDDGYVYCLDAETGDEIWRALVGQSRLRVPGNGRLISMWPVRTGVVVSDDIAYACAGVFPSETIFLAALNAETGKRIWQSTMNDFPAQGYLLASATRLYVTTGRNRPLVFDISNGKRLYQVAGGAGGTYALLTGDTLVYGPGKSGNLATIEPGVPDQLATFGGNHMVVRHGTAFLHTDIELTRLERRRYLALAKDEREVRRKLATVVAAAKKENRLEASDIKKQVADFEADLKPIRAAMATCVAWRSPCDCPFSLVATANQLVAGGAGKVAIYAQDSGAEQWQHAVQGNVYGLAVANRSLLVSTDAGAIYCFAGAN